MSTSMWTHWESFFTAPRSMTQSGTNSRPGPDCITIITHTTWADWPWWKKPILFFLSSTTTSPMPMMSKFFILWHLQATNSLDRSAHWCLPNVSSSWAQKSRLTFSWKKHSTMKLLAAMRRPKLGTGLMSEVLKPLPPMTKKPSNLSSILLQSQPPNSGPDNLGSLPTGH